MLFSKSRKRCLLSQAWIRVDGANVFNVFYFLHGLRAPSALYIYNISFAQSSKSLYFNRRFEFPACAKLFRSTITFLTVCLLFYLKKDLTSHIEDPL